MYQPAVKRTAVRFAARPWALGALAGLGLLLPGLAHLKGGTLAAQMPAVGGQLPAKSYMNKSVFYLPVHMDERARGGLQEIQLYVKDNPAAPWTLQQKAQPTATVFPFRPPHDGEYWFTVVTVDKAGRQMPPDLSREGPGVIVVQDSRPPDVDVRPLPAAPEGQYVQCEVRDANLDPSRTRFEYQSADQQWRGGEAVPGRPDTFCIPQQATHTGMVRVTAADRAGNVTVKEFNLAHTALSPNPSAPARQVAGPAPAPEQQRQGVPAARSV